MKKPGIGICFMLLLLLCLLIYPAFCFPQDNTIALKASFDTGTEKVGSIVNLTLSFNLPEGATISKPPVIKGLEGFTLVDQHVYPDKIAVRLFANMPGIFKTGEISLFYLDKEGRQQTLISAPVSLKILSNLGGNPDKAQLRPLEGIIPTRSLLLKCWPWLCALIVLIIAGFIIFRWHRIYKRKKLFLEYADPPHILARKNIEKLNACGLFEKGKVKEFYFQFSEIIKRYLESIRGFPAAEYTTEEIASHIDNEKDREILPLLRHFDLVKFADDLPTSEEKNKEIIAALTYIEQTAPVYDAKDYKKAQEDMKNDVQI